jgi:1,4-alpha-glucan branching enzyme
MITKVFKRILMVLLLAVCFVANSWAADYVDDINLSAEKHGKGQRVIYEMNIGSFTTDGTFTAAQARLEELKALGIDIVWLMPIYPRGGGINSPYAATNFQQTNPKYGTIADLKAFVARAHELQMEVWLDWVPNHTATNADWVTTHPEYYATSGGNMIHPNNYGDVWQLDYNNPDLVDAMNACLKFWIDETDIDGYRCDYISSPKIPASYWQTTIPMIKSYKAITFLGEADIASDATRLKDVGFDYDYAWQFQSSLANYGTGNTSARLKAFINTLLDKSAGLSFGRMLYVTNHDQNFNESKKTLTQKYGDNRYPLTVLAYTIYGMPLIYNGQETGGNQALDYFNDTKINWDAKDEKMLNTLRTLFALKHAVPAISDAQQSSDNPTTTLLNVSDNTSVLAYTRTLGDCQVLVVLNMGTTAATATIEGITAGDWSLWLNSETIAQGTSRKQTALNATHTFSLDAKGYRVYVSGTYPEQEVTQHTAISSVQSTQHNDGKWYTLTGQLIPRPTKRGLYIHNGRKVII